MNFKHNNGFLNHFKFYFLKFIPNIIFDLWINSIQFKLKQIKSFLIFLIPNTPKKVTNFILLVQKKLPDSGNGPFELSWNSSDRYVRRRLVVVLARTLTIKSVQVRGINSVGIECIPVSRVSSIIYRSSRW